MKRLKSLRLTATQLSRAGVSDLILTKTSKLEVGRLTQQLRCSICLDHRHSLVRKNNLHLDSQFASGKQIHSQMV